MTSCRTYLVVIPTYNEADSIASILEHVLENEVHVLVVDDGSPDGTGGLVERNSEFGERVFLLGRSGKGGFASACKAGYEWGLAHGYAGVGTMDADRSHDPKDISRLIAALDQGAEMAVGSRYLCGIRIINWPMKRLFLSWFAGVYARALCGVPMTDPTSGFKMISRKALERVDWALCVAEGYGFQIELHFFSVSAGCKLQEVPIIFTERREGVSKMSKRIIVEAAWTVLGLGFRRVRRAVSQKLRKAASIMTTPFFRSFF